MDRARILCSLGHNVMISNFLGILPFGGIFFQFTRSRMGLTMGVEQPGSHLRRKYYRHVSGGILEAFGKLFFKGFEGVPRPHVRSRNWTVDQLRQPQGASPYEGALQVLQIQREVGGHWKFQQRLSGHLSRDVLDKIENNQEGWEEMLPDGVAQLIKDKKIVQLPPIAEGGHEQQNLGSVFLALHIVDDPLDNPFRQLQT